MRFTFKWLKEHLNTEMSCDQIVSVLNKIGFEVEKVENIAEKYSEIIVGHVTKVLPHENAKKLSVCKVFNGKDELQIVCGASNVSEGIKVPLAMVGAHVNGFDIEACSLRGVESYGMICSEEELGFAEESEGIMILNEGAVPGMPFAQYCEIDDHMIEVSLMPNRRQDCASVRGLARDLAAAGAGSLIALKELSVYDKLQDMDVKMQEGVGCDEISFYNLNIEKGISISSKIRGRLVAIDKVHDLELVNLSNYVMYDLGRPNHFYDADKFEGNIRIRKSRAGEEFLALDGEKYVLSDGLMVVADDKKILSLAGIIGGESSKITKDTRNVVIEVANFAQNEVMKSGRHVMIHTDSRMRFESGIDQEMTEHTFSLFFRELGECVTPRARYVKQNLLNKNEMSFTYDNISKILGHSFSKEYIDEKLRALGFEFIANDAEHATLLIPRWRANDISSEEDIAEEIVRLYGIEKITPQPLNLNEALGVHQHRSSWNMQFKMQNLLRSRGMHEMISWSFYDRDVADIFGGNIEIANPISQSMVIMRQSIIPQLFQIARRSITRGEKSFAIFETGNVYFASDDASRLKVSRDMADSTAHEYDVADMIQLSYQTEECIQSFSASGLRFGKKYAHAIHNDNRFVDFYDIKEDVYAILNESDIEILNISDQASKYFCPGKSARITFADGYADCGEMHPKVLKDMDISEKVVAFEIIFHTKHSNTCDHIAQKFSKYQISRRDLSFLLHNDVSSHAIISAARDVPHASLMDVAIFDIYNIDDEQKAVGLSLKIQSAHGTMKDKEINDVVESVVHSVETKVGGRHRKSE